MKLILQAIKSIFSKFENRASALDATCKELRDDLDSFKKGAIPFFDLAELGMPSITSDGKYVSWYYSNAGINDEILQALENGLVRVRVFYGDSAYNSLLCATRRWDLEEGETAGRKYYAEFAVWGGSKNLTLVCFEFEINSMSAIAKSIQCI